MGDTSLPGSAQVFALVGGFSGVTALLTWFTTHKASKASNAKLRAETTKIEHDDQARDDTRRVDFERVLNERAIQVMDALRDQVGELSSLVRTQSERIQKQTELIQAQSSKIQEMEHKIQELSVALEKTTHELHKARAQSSSPFIYSDPII